VYHYAALSFLHLAHAEAKTHGVGVDEVHFHEVGAIDSIIDVCGVWCMCYLLKIDPAKISCSALPSSEGTVWTEHGILPVPAPATARLMEGFKVVPGPKTASGELCTPTGVAILRAAVWDPVSMTLDKERVGRWRGTGGRVGVGAGTKEFGGHPNVLRCFIAGVVEVREGTLAPLVPRGDQISFSNSIQSSLPDAVKQEHEELDDDDYWLKYGVERSSSATPTPTPTTNLAPAPAPAPTASSPNRTSAATPPLKKPERIHIPLRSPPRDHVAHPTHRHYDADGEMILISKTDLKKMVEDMVTEKLTQSHSGAKAVAPTFRPSRSPQTLPSPPPSKIESPFWDTSELLHLRCNLDDVTAEVIGHVSEVLMDSGALDVWTTAITMKKSRSAIEFNVLCEEVDGTRFLEIMFRNTTTLGVRCERVERAALKRTFQEVDTKLGEGKSGVVSVKIGWLGEDAVTIHPEFEHCKRISKDSGIPIKVVMDAARTQVLR
jgi:uncharacterized protein (DUF111 family)